MMAKQTQKITIQFRKDDDGKYWAWIEQYGISTSGDTKEEAQYNAEKILDEILNDEELLMAYG